MSEDKDIEDLIKIASREVDAVKAKPSNVIEETKKKLKKRKYNKQELIKQRQMEVDSFLQDLGIKNGEYKIRAGLVYEAFKLYSDLQVSAIQFFQQLAIKIHHPVSSKTAKKNFYYINMSNWKLQVKAYKAKEKRNEIKRKATKKETDQAINDQVPCFSEGSEFKDSTGGD